KRDELTVLMYHQHIPQPDPMTNTATQTRSKFYAVQGVPHYVINGVSGSGGGGSRDFAQSFYDRVNPDIEKELEKAPTANMKLDIALDGSIVRTKVAVSNIRSDAEKLKLQIALAENRLSYSGENGIRFHPMVVRSLAGLEYKGFIITSKDNQKFE